MRFRIRNALIGGAIYLFVFSAIADGGGVIAVLLLAVYAVGCMLVERALIRGAQARRTGHAVEFSQTGAANALGIQYGSFHHVYHSPADVNERLRMELGRNLQTKLGCAAWRELQFKDVDDGLDQPESRTFLVAPAPTTVRRSDSFLLCTFHRAADVQSVRWWLLVSGVRDPNKLFWRYARAPFTTLLALRPYWKRRYDPLNGLMTIYPGFFNEIDVLNRVREIQYVAFETLVEVLNSFDIDTTDLKAQKGNILNVNVSGGKASFGSVVQGAMNNVAGVAGGVKA